MNKTKIRFITNFLYFAIIILILYLLLKYALPYFAPFILAYAIAAMVQPLTRFISLKLKLKTKLSGILSVIIAWVVFAIIIGLILYIIFKQTAEFLSNPNVLSELITTATEKISELTNNIYNVLPNISTDLIDTTISSLSESIITSVNTLANKTITFITDIFKITPSVIIFILISILSSVFIASDYNGIIDFINNQIPAKYRSKVVLIKQFYFGTALKLFKSYLIIMLITFIELITGLSIIGVKYVLILSLLIALFDILPYVGSGTVLVPWGIIELLSNNYFKGFAIIILAFIITIIRNFLEPKLIGKETNTHPLLILIAVYIGGKILGVLGIIICPITIIFTVKLYKDGYINSRHEKKETA